MTYCIQLRYRKNHIKGVLNDFERETRWKNFHLNDEIVGRFDGFDGILKKQNKQMKMIHPWKTSQNNQIGPSWKDDRKNVIDQALKQHHQGYTQILNVTQ